MSLSLGQSESYINKIENRKALPSMSGFFYICEYLKVHPRDFFDEGVEAPALFQELIEEMKSLNTQQAACLLTLLKDLKRYPEDEGQSYGNHTK